MNCMTLALLAFVVLQASSTSAESSLTKDSRYEQVQTANGWEFWDKDGLAFRLDKNQVVVYTRELMEYQRRMNSTLPPNAPYIPETGRYNYETLIYSYFRLENQWAELDRARRTFAEHKTKRLEKYLEAGLKTINHHKAAIDRFKGADFISEREIPALQDLEREASRSMMLAFLEAQRLVLQEQGEMLDPKALAKSIGRASSNPHVKGSLLGQAQGLRQRTDRLQATYVKHQERLGSAAPGDFDSIQAAVNASHEEYLVLDKDLRRFAEALGFRKH